MALYFLVPLPGYFPPRHSFSRFAPFLLLNATFSERPSLSISFHLTPEVLVFFFTLAYISLLYPSSLNIFQVFLPTEKHRIHLFSSRSFFRYYKSTCNRVDFHDRIFILIMVNRKTYHCRFVPNVFMIILRNFGCNCIACCFSVKSTIISEDKLVRVQLLIISHFHACNLP